MKRGADLFANLASLANLDPKQLDQQSLQMDVEGIINFFDLLSEVDTSGVKPFSFFDFIPEYLRDDKINCFENPSAFLDQAPEQQDGYFLFPPVLPTGKDKQK